MPEVNLIKKLSPKIGGGMPALRLDLLGGFQLFIDGREIRAPSAKKARGLLAYLAFQKGRAVPRDRLIALLWSRNDHQRARHSLSQALSALKHAVGDAGAESLELAFDWVRLAPGVIEIDALRFAELAAAPGRESLDAAVTLYRGELLDGLIIKEAGFESWLHSERQHLRELAVAALDKLLNVQAKESQWADVVATALKLVTIDSLDERAHRALMSAYAHQGNAQAALRQFHELEALLKAELGVEPEAETRELRHDIVHNRTRSRKRQPTQKEPEAAGNEKSRPTGGSIYEESTPGTVGPHLSTKTVDFTGGAPVTRQSTPAGPRRRQWNFSFSHGVVATIAIIVLVGATFWRPPWTQKDGSLEAGRLSIVVLPFHNLFGNSKQDYFVDGITADLIVDLSRIRGSFVIARGTSFTYKGKNVNSRKVAKDLAVRYVLEGGVRRAGDKIRVSAQLIDGETGSQVWSDRFDRKYVDVFSLQNEITGRIANALKGQLLQAVSDRYRNGPPTNLIAWDYAIQGAAYFFKGPRVYEHDTLRAKELLEKAIALDPNLSLAWEALGRAYIGAAFAGQSWISRTKAREKMLEAAKKAVSLDPRNASAKSLLGNAYRVHRQPQKALLACQSALEINPNEDNALSCIGRAKIALGDPKGSYSDFEKSLRLNPFGRPANKYYYWGIAHLVAEEHEEAVKKLKKSISLDPKYSSPHWALASALAWLGREDEARRELAEFIMLDRKGRDTITGLKKLVGYLTPNLEHVLEGLRRAGMSER